MDISFDKALEKARSLYPLSIDHYEEYASYYMFEQMQDVEQTGGPSSPIVIRKSDGAALNYAPIFFNMAEDAEDVGDVLSEGTV